ncbi:RNA polymerase sigma factor [Parabacteroides sp. PF5-9]|uniref:RNA polymerase sigma factor n=1 Tax=Parabacteroides sp. PF5-9 TaxID=1742404 RepID=UPI002474DB7C|nr:RNA polymerase sigma factor [Parabacteroides sp. PF5-9]MDH6358527.1 RNA polymerase sigma-70 factor (ECF subfamily) [Parabacteroides sp. PF5-9]
MSESEMISGCREGDNSSRKKLYELYAEKMLRLCYRYTGDMDIAHDLLHDGFIKVFSAISSFTSKREGSLNAWLNKIFTNTALEYLRKKDLLRTGISLDHIAELPEEPEPDASLISIEQLMKFVTDLPVGYRTVFNLYVFEEWSHKEIAQHLHINEKSSTSQLSRARKILADRIREQLKKQERI